MENVDRQAVDKAALDLVVIEIKLFVNQRLYNKGAITQEMYTRAKEMILKGSRTATYAAS